MSNGLIISSAAAHGKYLPRLLAKKLEKNGIPVLLSKVCWPRDELAIYLDGNYDNVQKRSYQGESFSHFAWNGGTFLKGDNFIVGSLTGNPENKQEATHNMLGVERGFYFDISRELDALNHIKVNRDRDFFKSDFPHMDVIYNIGNSSRVLITYDHPKLIETGERMESLTDYQLVTIPLEEARFAAVGFVEIGNKIVIDRRAKKTKKVLEKIGYEVITTPLSLKETNGMGGSLRCATTEIPIELERIKLMHPNNARDKVKDGI